MTSSEAINLVNSELKELREYCAHVHDNHGNGDEWLFNLKSASRKQILAEIIRTFHNTLGHTP